MTRFFNERYFATRLEQETHRAIRSRESLSLVVLGVDGLNELRREVGNESTNTFLGNLVDHIVGGLRATDVGCRIADDELAIILPASAASTRSASPSACARTAAPPGSSPPASGCRWASRASPTRPATPISWRGSPARRSALARRHGGERTFLFDREVAAMIDDQDLREQQANESLLATIVGVAAAVDDRHPTTRGHSQNVAHISALLAQELGLSVDRIEEVRLAGLLHDVGKIGVSDELISRPGPLEPHEWDEMRQHPEIAYRMLSGADLGDVRTFVRFHHERFDGSGYPDWAGGRADPDREPHHRRGQRAGLHDPRPPVPDRDPVPRRGAGDPRPVGHPVLPRGRRRTRPPGRARSGRAGARAGTRTQG